MAATKRQFNWEAVGFTPTLGTLQTITGVTNVAIAGGGTLAKFSGDNDRYPTTVVNDFNDPTVTITSADIIALSAFATGQRGVVTATHRDAKGATGGGITYTLTGAVVANVDVGGAHRQFGSGTVSFSVESSDGQTNPIGTALA